MRGLVLGAALGVALASVGAAGAYAASCDDKADKAAFHVRSLQTELMVAALTCGARYEYNVFVNKFQKTLIDQGRALKRQFRNTLGGAGERELNAYVTAVANRASERSIHSRDAYCTQAGRTFAALEAMSPTDLAAFSLKRPAGDVDVPSTCRPETILVEKTE